LIFQDCLTANGTAVVVVCVTGAASRMLVSFVSRKVVPVASKLPQLTVLAVRAGLWKVSIVMLLSAVLR